MAAGSTRAVTKPLLLDMTGSTSGHLVRNAGSSSRPNAVFFLSVPVGVSWEVVLTLLYISRS